ncbi:MAG: hypothetical protein ACREQJ_05040 [Candidatus Binatia bacterium]
MLLWLLLRSGTLRTMDGEKLRYFFGLTPKLYLSRRRPLWRSVPWFRALFSPRDARAIHVWLRYRIELFDGLAG